MHEITCWTLVLFLACGIYMLCHRKYLQRDSSKSLKGEDGRAKPATRSRNAIRMDFPGPLVWNRTLQRSFLLSDHSAGQGFTSRTNGWEMIDDVNCWTSILINISGCFSGHLYRPNQRLPLIPPLMTLKKNSPFSMMDTCPPNAMKILRVVIKGRQGAFRVDRQQILILKVCYVMCIIKAGILKLIGRLQEPF